MKYWLKTLAVFFFGTFLTSEIFAQDTIPTKPGGSQMNLPSTSGLILKNFLSNPGAASQLLQSQNLQIPQNLQLPQTNIIQQQTPTTPTISSSPILYSQSPDTVISIMTDTDKLPKPVVYGQNFLRGSIIKPLIDPTKIQATDDYILDVGDKLTIAIWGFSSFNNSYTIDNSGAIYPTNVGKIFLKGFSFSQAKALIKSRFSDAMDISNSNVDISLIYSRVITVNIVGEVFEPGTYTLPAINSIFNALVAARGPNNFGSMRTIFVKRNGVTVKSFDLYKFLLDSTSQDNFTLQNNDYIVVPRIGKVISINGRVQKPFKYELLPNENLKSILEYAGGLLPDAISSIIQIHRISDNTSQNIDVKYDSFLLAHSDFILEDGDEITINEVNETNESFIKITGSVLNPGKYSYSSGMTLSQLITKAGGFTNNSYLKKGYILRTFQDQSQKYIPFIPSLVNTDPQTKNLVLEDHDVITIFSNDKFLKETTVSIQGDVSSAGTYNWANAMTLKDLIYIAGGLGYDADYNDIEIIRIISSSDGISFVPLPELVTKTISITAPLESDEISEQFLLQPYDVVYIRTIPNFGKFGTVLLQGEVKYPGLYSLTSPIEKLTDVVTRAGGLEGWAFSKGTTLIRKSNAKGFVFMRLDKAIKHPNGKWNLILEPGDQINIPIMTDVVTISGFVDFPYVDSFRQVTVPYAGSWHRAKYYIKKYGLGFSEFGKKSATYVIQPGNNVVDVNNIGPIKVYPHVPVGSVIVVPQNPDKSTKQKSQHTSAIDWNNAIESTLTKVTAIISLIVLVNKAF